jgi:glycine/D-amino acid oxidase-like deaminating enzyme/nitrite reductase/ring-hydroxylating ferredoxin subunit
MTDRNFTLTNRDGSNTSLWQLAGYNRDVAISNEPQIYDVLIVGGGITGLTTALNLQREGKSCLVVEAENIGFGTTGGTSAHLNTFLDATYPEIDSDFGKDTSKLLASAAKRMIGYIESNINELEIDADFNYRDAYLFSQNEKETKELQEIFESSKEAGVQVTESDRNGLSIDFLQSIKFSGQAQFHPIKYINGLAQGFQKLGGKIVEGRFITDSKFVDGIHVSAYSEGEIKSKNIIWATHIPPGINLLSLRNAPYRSYVLAVRLKNDDYPACLAYDMQEPYHYFRTHQIEEQQYLLVGGADHKTGHDDPEQAFIDLENYVKEHFDIASIDYRWSSQYYVPVDGLPYIGPLPGGSEGAYVATGFNGNGMIFGSLSGEILTDLIIGKENELAKILSPSRLKPVSGFTEFIKENADVAYHFVADRFGTELIESLNQLSNDEGKVVEFDGKKLAIYKDSTGTVNALSPVCTHAGCIVNWNATEKSWDCPCHGGRFSIDGAVLTGPPTKGLKKIELQ